MKKQQPKKEIRFRIESGIPVAPRMGGGSRGASKYPFARMKVGQSFGFPIALIRRIDGAARKWREVHQPKWLFVSRRLANGKARIWRTK